MLESMTQSGKKQISQIGYSCYCSSTGKATVIGRAPNFLS